MTFDPLCGWAYPCLVDVPFWRVLLDVLWEAVPAPGFTLAGIWLGGIYANLVIMRDW